MVLQNPLDREKEETHTLVLLASDGGEPHRSGTVRIHITVLDANDNAPVCSQPVYKADVKENSAVGSVVTTVSANDADKGVNGEVTYSIGHVAKETKQLFEVNVKTGEIKVAGTTIAVVNVDDEDSDGNGVVKCSINSDVPFKIESSLTGYYTIVTEDFLDRESIPEYNITITVSDQGSPPLSSSKNINVKVSDVNDSPPKFDQSEYSKTVPENNSPGFSVFTVSASDADWGQNARVSYFLQEKQINGAAVSSLVSVNSENGVIHAVRSFDYEQIKWFEFNVTARDAGSPPLSSVATVKIMIQDQNDNPPQVLYPVQTGGSLVAEMVPRSADVGYLVTKVVAVDVDSGQNAWLSYKLQKATDRALFEVGLQNGEIRTIRQVTDKDAVKQRLTVIVEDNGQPSRSATVIVNVAVADSFPEVLSEFTDFPHDKEYNDNLTFYLVLALAVVSFLFITCLVVIISVKIYRWRQSRVLYHSSLPVIPYYPPRYSDTLGTGTLPHVYNYELSSVSGQARYSVPEEQAEGSFVGNIGRDLGLDVARLISGKARIITKGSRQYVDLNRDKGTLVIKERIDREELCGKTTPCSFSFEVILENPIQLYRVTVEVIDINDNSPSFPKDEIHLNIAENAAAGTRFSLESADDPDVGVNDIKKYTLKPSDNFKLEVQSQPDGGAFIEMVLQNPLDREKEETHTLVLLASDGGEPHRSGTVRIHITVLDANDNAPVCSQPVYKADVKENSAVGSVVTTVSANDADKGVNAEVTYSIGHVAKETKQLFEVNVKTGEIKVAGKLDYEKSKMYQLNVKASDHGGFTDTCKVNIQIIDENDNVPTIQLMSFSNSISEDSPPGTTIAVVNVDDEDSDGNGVVKCSINSDVPFKIESSLTGYYTIVTEDFLDRESTPEYNITITVSDQGSPPLSSSKSINVKVSDVNDSPPKFDQSEYSKTVPENNSPGLSVFTVSATDADWGQNARVSYFLQEKEINGAAVSSLVSVNSENGVIHAVRSFDYEQIKWFEFNVTARDAGSPPLSSVATVRIIVQDQNDNPPQVLYPVQTGGSLVAEMVPRSADVGYLVTKVVAVDVDSGQNAWLSYKLQKATDRALFEVGLQNGEIRTIRQVTDKDAVKQRLTVIVEDNGQPSRSATVIVNVAVADSFPEVLSEFTDFPHDKEYNDNLTFYLVLALAVVSFLFITCLVVIISVKIYRWRQSRVLYHSSLPVIPYYPPRYSDTLGTGTLPHVYNYEVCRTTDSRKSDCKFGRAGSQNVLIMDPSSTGTMQRIQSEKSILDEPDSPLEVLYPVQTGGSLVAEMVPRSADVGYLVTKVVAVDVDSGQNAWLSYKLQKATDRALFEVGSQNGEIRTIRQVTDKDAVKQRLTVIVEDNGQPSRSATVIVNVAVADSFPEVLSEFTDFPHDKEYNDNLTFYLVLALAVVSFLFITCLVVIISVKIYRWRQSRVLYHSSLPVIPYYPPRYSDTLGTGTLPHVYNYEVCRTTDSRRSDCKFGRAGSQNVLIMDPSSTGTMQRMQSEKSILDEPDSPLEVRPLTY
ncbi:protocadherin gamma-A10-like [Pagrus major]|uniref:protocadherin gamma-A10-like n=1 Tax=Pagrus major TaxID=143350 RepID=UPI003CC8DCFF